MEVFLRLSHLMLRISHATVNTNQTASREAARGVEANEQIKATATQTNCAWLHAHHSEIMRFVHLGIGELWRVPKNTHAMEPFELLLTRCQSRGSSVPTHPQSSCAISRQER